MSIKRLAKTWMTANRLEALGWIAVVAAWLLQGYAGVFRRDNDFLWHLDRGKEFLAGHPLRTGTILGQEITP